MWSTWKKFWQPAGRASVRPWLTKKLSAAHIVLTIPVTKKDHVPYTLELLCLWLMNKQFNSCSRVRCEKLFIGGEGLMTITMTTSTNITTTITTTIPVSLALFSTVLLGWRTTFGIHNLFYRPAVLPVAHRAVSNHWTENGAAMPSRENHPLDLTHHSVNIADTFSNPEKNSIYTTGTYLVIRFIMSNIVVTIMWHFSN